VQSNRSRDAICVPLRRGVRRAPGGYGRRCVRAGSGKACENSGIAAAAPRIRGRGLALERGGVSSGRETAFGKKMTHRYLFWLFFEKILLNGKNIGDGRWEESPARPTEAAGGGVGTG
jgi:hypothetical protein